MQIQTLSISNADESDKDIYRCKAMNEKNNYSTSDFTVNILGSKCIDKTYLANCEIVHKFNGCQNKKKLENCAVFHAIYQRGNKSSN